MATPEKALLDWIHLEPGGADPGFLRELRLQHTELLDPKVLRNLALRARSPKLERAAARLEELATEEGRLYESA